MEGGRFESQQNKSRTHSLTISSVLIGSLNFGYMKMIYLSVAQLNLFLAGSNYFFLYIGN